MRTAIKRAITLTLQVALIATMFTTGVLVRPQRAAAAGVCSPGAGQDGSPGTLSGTYNTYYSPPNGTVTAGTTSINVGAIDTTGGGASTVIGVNDLLLIMQMQDGSFNSSNSSSYGDGATGSGYTSLGQAGLYEYVYVSAIAGANATIVGGSGGGLLNTYTKSAGPPQKTYQIIRVPQFVDATLSNTFRSAYWDGSTGGVAALDLASTLNLNGASLYATGNGFRGGGLTQSGTSPAGALNSDWAASAIMNGTTNANPPADGSKGEGVMGTPDWVFEYTNFATPSTPASPVVNNGSANGYPGGDQAKGAPGNAGGGGTDMDLASNDQNTGGGGGGNGGAGGIGGFPWTPNYTGNTAQYSQTSPGVHAATAYSIANTGDIGGRGGSSVSPSVTRLFMGGGGGAGSNNNGSNNNAFNALGSSGGVGGGIVMMRIANTSGTPATIFANGTTGLAPDNDGGGGGGAGGTILVTSPNTFTGITAHSDGAAGTTAAAADAFPAVQHGPGGGGGGGIVLSSSPVTTTVAGGANGTTTPSATSYGATPGSAGTSLSISDSQIPGVKSGAQCYTGGSTGRVFTGPVGGNATTGSYDGVIAINNNNDFTAWGFIPAGASLTNSGTTPGTPIGNTIPQGPTTVNVPNEFDYNNTSGVARTLTLTVTAPTSPAGWTARICPDVANAPSCGALSSNWTAIGVAGATSSSTWSEPSGTDSGAVKYWAVYSAPANLQAFTSYDAPIFATAPGALNHNWTHDELYAGFLPLTKSQTISSSGCPAGEAPVYASGVCPGGVILYAIDYRNIVAGAASESTFTSAWPSTAAGQFTITENGAASGNTWGANSTGLKEALVAGANGTTTFGDSYAGSTFTGNVIGSTSFTDTPGGASGRIQPSGGGIAGAVNQGTLWFRVTIK